ncbi:MAG: TonB C-terminal domain-containing protein [Terracidiphilus sp.]|jgi:outer membrane biosynthesis protein TonB
MLSIKAPIDENEPAAPAAAIKEVRDREPEPASPIVRGSRWVDYDTHELLEMISDLEDERRWARLREGVLWAVIVHAAIILAMFLLPKYIYQPRVIEPSTKKTNDDWTYLDSPIVPPKLPAQKATVAPPVRPQIDKKTLEAMNRPQPPVPQPAPPQPAPAPAPAPAPPPPPVPQTQQPQVEAPRPQAVPRPSFSMGSQNPIDQLHDAMKGASGNPGYGSSNLPSGGGLAMHPGAGTGGVEVLNPEPGVDLGPWLRRWHWETQKTWDPLIPDEVNPPILKQGQVLIHFKVLPDGRIMEGSMMLEGRSGDTALDRAAWGALQGSNYPPLPKDFHQPYLELRALFMYNMRQQ